MTATEVAENTLSMDQQMAVARRDFDWGAQFECTIDGERRKIDTRDPGQQR